uniref:Uncharacterized protein n=1 Tax=Thermofilum pendens TaxID=2269 RepID=A0A7C3SLF2_THEPE
MCVVSKNLVCASSKTYVLKIREDCFDKVVRLLEERGKVTAKYGPLVKGAYRDAVVTLVRPDKVQVILQFSNMSIEEFEKELESLG